MITYDQATEIHGELKVYRYNKFWHTLLKDRLNTPISAIRVGTTSIIPNNREKFSIPVKIGNVQVTITQENANEWAVK